MSRPRVAILRFHEITQDPRTSRIARTLAERDDEVRVYSFQFAKNIPIEEMDGYCAIRLPNPVDPLDSEAFYAAMGELAAVMKALWPFDVSQPAPIPVSPLTCPTPLSRRVLHKSKSFVMRQLTCILARLNDEVSAVSPLVAVAKNPLAERDFNEHRWRMNLNYNLAQSVAEWQPTHVYACDLDTLFAGVMLKLKLGIPLVYDAFEIWAHQFPNDYRSAEYLGYYLTIERLMLDYADGRITVGEGLAKYFEYAYGSKPFIIAPNTPNVASMVDEKILLRRSKRRSVYYHGSYTRGRGLEEIIDVVPLLDDCRVIFRGVGSEYEALLRQIVKERGLSKRIEFLTPVKINELVSAASKFDIGLLPFTRTCLNTYYAFPNKLFEYMMGGLALASSDLVDQRRIIKHYNMGVVFDIYNREQVAASINNLLRNPDMLDEMRRNAWQTARNVYNWEKTSQDLKDLFTELGV